LFVGLVLFGWTQDACAQADWSAKIINQRDLEKKEILAFQNAMRQAITDDILLALAEKERHGPAVASVAGQYFEKMTQVPASLVAMRALFKRQDIGDKAIAFAVTSPMAEQLVAAMVVSRDGIDQQNAARMIAALSAMRRGEHIKLKQATPNPQPAPADPSAQQPAWLTADYSASLAALIENSKSRDALECAFLAAGLDRVQSLKEQAKAYQTHRVAEVASAARFAYAALGGEIDVQKLLVDLADTEPQKVRDPLSYDPRQTRRVYAIMAAGQAKVSEAVEPLIGFVNDPDPHVAVAAARALGQIGGQGASVRLLEAMNDQTTWPARIAMYEAIGANPDAAAVRPLLERMKAESGRLRQDALYALLSIAAQKNDNLSIDGFDSWWMEHGQGFTADPTATQSWRSEHRVGQVDVQPFAGFYETAVISDRMVFAIDASKSINEQQLLQLQQTLTEIFEQFPESIQFNLVDFGGHVRVMGKGRMISGKVRERALDVFLKQTELTGGTRIFDAIETAMSLPDVDTIHFLSDGAPYGSQLNDWKRIDYVTRLRTSDVPIAVHVVFLSRAGQPENLAKQALPRAIREFADAHSGRFKIMVADVPQ